MTPVTPERIDQIKALFYRAFGMVEDEEAERELLIEHARDMLAEIERLRAGFVLLTDEQEKHRLGQAFGQFGHVGAGMLMNSVQGFARDVLSGEWQPGQVEYRNRPEPR
jgi:hypothetical protein